MEPDFWLERWREARTGFHQEAPTPLLLKHWPAVGAEPGSRVFVPLAGKSLDMAWFASQGCRVLGAELSPLAVAQFFENQGVEPSVDEAADGVHHVAGPIELVQGDVFALDADAVASCTAVFDRAAIIALPREMRARYVREVYGKLPSGCRGLLITLEYPQQEKAGPPFSVAEDEVRALFDGDWLVTLLERRDILEQQPNFQAEGVTALETAVYRLERR
ncbi:MAG: thiopurine S-methyltransferase [Luteimonas sp.]